MPTSDGGDIKLSVGLDTEKASKDAQQLDRALSKAFSSSDTKVKEYGYQLDKVTQKLEAQKLKVAEIGKQKIPTQEFENLGKRIESTFSELNKTNEAINQMRQSGTDTTASKGYVQLLSDEKYMLEQLEPLYEKYNNWKKIGFDDKAQAAAPATSEMGQNYKQMQILEEELRDIQDEMTQMEKAGKHVVPTQEFVEATQQASNLEDKLNQLNATSTEMQQNGTAYTLGKDTEAYRQASIEAGALANKQKSLVDKILGTKSSADALSNSLKKIGSAGSSMINRLTGFFKKLRTDIDKTSNTHQKSFKKMLNTILKYGFGIRSIFLLYRKLRAVISEGLGEMAKQFSDVEEDVYGLKNAWSGFKSGIVSAFQPIFAYVVPALVTLINYLTTAMNTLANFFAMLTGQGYYYKAKKGTQSVAKGIEGTGKAADKANEKLAEYDDLIVIQQDKDSSGGGGGGGAGDGSAWNWEKVDATASSLAEKLKGIWDVFKQAWQAKGQDVIDAFNYAVSSTKALLLDIADTFYRVFTDGYGFDWLVSCLGVLEQILLTIGDISTAFKNAWDKDNNGYNLIASFFEMLTAINNMCIQIGISFRNAWNSGLGEKIIENILHIITNIQLTVKALADNFTEAWTEAGRGDLIFKHLLEIVQQITQFFEDITNSLKEWAENLDFAPLLDGFDSFVKGVKRLLEPVLELIKTLWNDYVLPFAKNFIEKYAPKILSILGKVIGNFAPLVDAVKNLAHAFEPILNQITDNFWDGLLIGIDLVADVLGVVIEALAGIVNWIAEIETFIQGNPILSAIQAMLNPLQSVAGVVELIKGGFNSWSGIFETIVDSFSAMWQGIKNGVETLKKYFEVGFKYILNLILDNVKAIWDGIKNILADWKAYFENLWNTIVNIFKGVGAWFKQRFTEAWNNIKTAFSQVGTWFKARWNDIVNIFKVAGTWFKTTFTTAWNNIKSVFAQVGSFFSSVWHNITSAFSGVVGWFRNTFQNAWNAVKNVFSGWGSFFGNLWTIIRNKFTSIGTYIADAISGAVKSGLNYVIGRMESIINKGIRLINRAIKLANKIPGVNVSTLDTIELPRLARGGIVDRATLAQIGENGAEAVVPLEKNLGWLDKMATMITDKMADMELPLISQGNILPVTKAFMNTASDAVDNSGITSLLQSILDRLDNLERGDDTPHDPVILELDGKTVAQVVWDESEKRYKQTGTRYAY